MKKILLTVGVIFLVIIAALSLISFFLPQQEILNKVLAQVTKKTGLDVTVDGDFSFSVFPNIALSIEKVTVKNPKETKTLASVEEAKVKLSLFKIITGKVQVDSLDLEKPSLYYEIKKDGTDNWTSAMEKTPQISAIEEAPTENGEDKDAASSSAASLSIDDIKIKDATLEYADLRRQNFQKIDQFNLDLDIKSLTSNIEAKGDFLMQGAKTKFDARLGHARVLNDPEAESDFKLNIDNDYAHFFAKGNIKSLIKNPVIDADVEAKIDDFTKFVTWSTGTKPKGDLPFKKISRSGPIHYENKFVRADQLNLKIDDSLAQGKASVNFAGVKPQISAQLNLDSISLDKFFDQAQNETSEFETASKPNKEEEQAEQIALTAAAEEGSTDLSVLQAFDGDFSVQIGSLSYKSEKLGPASFNGQVRNATLTSKTNLTQLFGGNAAVDLTAQAKGKSAYFDTNWALSQVEVEPVLRLLSDIKKLTGTMNSQGRVTMSGQNVAQLKSTMNGSGDFIVRNGAIKGINLAAISKDVTQLLSNPSGSTEFAELSASYVINGGRITTNNLQMAAPLIRMTGQGYVDLPTEEVNMHVMPKLVATSKGQGGTFDKVGLPIPFIVTGTISHPVIIPDPIGLATEFLKSPEAIKEGVKDLGKSVKNPGKLLENIIGGGGQEPAPTPAPTPTSPPPEAAPPAKKSNPVDDILKGVLGQ